MTRLLALLPPQSRLLVGMHRTLLMRSWAFDAVWAAVSIGYLFVPQNIEAISLENLLLGLFALFLSTQYHIHSIRVSCGGPGFYLMIPLDRARLLALAYAVAMLPYLVLVSLAGLVVAAATPLELATVAERIGHACVFYVLAKTLPLPTLVVWRMGTAYVLLFHLAFIPVGMVTLFLDEMLLSRLPLAPLGSVLAFLAGMVLLQWMVLRSTRLPTQ